MTTGEWILSLLGLGGLAAGGYYLYEKRKSTQAAPAPGPLPGPGDLATPSGLSGNIQGTPPPTPASPLPVAPQRIMSSPVLQPLPGGMSQHLSQQQPDYGQSGTSRFMPGPDPFAQQQPDYGQSGTSRFMAGADAFGRGANALAADEHQPAAPVFRSGVLQAAMRGLAAASPSPSAQGADVFLEAAGWLPSLTENPFMQASGLDVHPGGISQTFLPPASAHLRASPRGNAHKRPPIHPILAGY